MKTLTGMLLLILTMAVSHANATEYWATCNACSESQQRWTAIRTVPRSSPGFFDIYVMDFERVTLQKYRASSVWEPGDGYLVTVLKAPVEAHVAFEFEQSVRAIKHNLAQLESGTVIPAEVVPSAYEVIHSTVMRQRVIDYVNDNLSVWQTIALPVAVPLSAIGKIADLNFIISLTFSDGSTANLVLAGMEGALFSIRYTFELQEGSARDADGNLIPQVADQAALYSAISSNQANADALIDFIMEWYSAEMAPLVCTASHDPTGVTVTCKRR